VEETCSIAGRARAESAWLPVRGALADLERTALPGAETQELLGESNAIGAECAGLLPGGVGVGGGAGSQVAEERGGDSILWEE